MLSVGDETKHKNRKHHPNRPDPRVAVLSNDPAHGTVSVGIEGWHVDGNVVPVPHAFTIIHSMHAIEYGDRGAARRLRGAYDTCVAAALVYDRALHAPLVATLAELRPARLLLCNSAWSPSAMDDFIALLGVHFDAARVHRLPPDHGLGGGAYAVDVWECRPRAETVRVPS